MATDRKKRAMVLVGAGASLDFGAPSVADLTESIRQKVAADAWMRKIGGDTAYRVIYETLSTYLLGGACAVNFEHVFHCAHELLFTFEPSPSTVNEYRPILQPFISRQIEVDEQSLVELVRHMAKFIFDEVSAICEAPPANLGLITSFLGRLRDDHVVRIYTTNYDDLLLQAVPDLYTGFDPQPSSDAKLFDRRAFWQATEVDCICHLHGSVHLAFCNDLEPSADADLGDLHWFDDRADALSRPLYYGSGDRLMDGSQIVRTPLITGLDKLSRLQQRPLMHYYASMAADAMKADIIYVIGCGLGDLHLNTWLAEARRMKPTPPLVLVDWWPESFLEDTAFESSRKTAEMVHTLHMRVNGSYYDGDRYGSGWTLSKDRNCAVWDKGFLAFLNAPSELDHVLEELADPGATDHRRCPLNGTSFIARLRNRFRRHRALANRHQS